MRDTGQWHVPAHSSHTRGDPTACQCLLEAETLVTTSRMAESRRSQPRCGSAPGTPTPTRRRTPSPGSNRDKPKWPPITRVTSMPDIKPLDKATHLLIQDQLARKKKLEIELDKDKETLEKMKKDAEFLQREVTARLEAPPHSSKVQKLRQEIANLHRECNKLTNEVDSTSNNEVPLGETRVEFYKNIYTGQRGPVRAKTSRQRERRRVEDLAGSTTGGGGEGPHWRCDMCTFLNHPLLDKCEECDMPRIVLDARETQNIHIRVTHRNYPSCKVVHSWVL